VSDPERLASIRAAADRRRIPFFEISAATHSGLEALVGEMFRQVAEGSQVPSPKSQESRDLEPGS
jgi:hypothetical protein